MTKKNILITGASRGMGFAIAKQLCGMSQNLLLTAKSPDNLRKATNELAAGCPAAVLGFPCDLPTLAWPLRRQSPCGVNLSQQTRCSHSKCGVLYRRGPEQL